MLQEDATGAAFEAIDDLIEVVGVATDNEMHVLGNRARLNGVVPLRLDA